MTKSDVLKKLRAEAERFKLNPQVSETYNDAADLVERIQPDIADFSKIEVTNHTTLRIRVTAAIEKKNLYIWLAPKAIPTTFQLKETQQGSSVAKSEGE